MTHTNLAEFRFPEHRFETAGQVSSMDAGHLTVRFDSLNGLPPALSLPARVEVYFMTKGVLRVLGAQLQSLQENIGQLSISEPVRQLHVRKDKRYPLRLPIDFRVARGSQFTPIWQKAVTQDISIGGMCMELPPHIDVPKRIEVIFNLLDVWMQSLWQQEKLHRDVRDLDVSEELKIIRTQGKVCDAWKTDEGKILLGLQFLTLDRPERLRLARILHDIYGESGKERKPE
jgi:c-di-GMP-binding flagellar brake protein YcgR